MKNLIDIEFIKKWTNISEEELMMRLVKDAVGLQAEAEENQKKTILEERKNDKSYSVEFIKKYFRQYSYLEKYFTPIEILEACKIHMAKRDFIEKMYLRGHHPNCSYGEFLEYTTHTFKEYKGRWEREVRDDATVVLVPNRYQDINGANEVIKHLLLSKFPFLNDYKLNVYRVDNQNDWFFIDNPNENEEYGSSSLYVPFSAIMEKDTDKIVGTHRKYWHNYGNGKYDEKTEEFLNSDFVKEILEKISETNL